jgi:glutathione synthase/RimK-type ligase-like ATP-grasp enzyme
MSIGLLYERSETDENGIKLTAQELGINLTFIPFRKIAISIGGKTGLNIATKGKNFTDTIKEVAVVLNRAQSKNRRLYAGQTMEILGKQVINPTSVEYTCYSKFRTLMLLWTAGVPIPKTVYVPSDSYDTTKDGRILHNEPDIADLLEREIGTEVILKPDAGTHGKAIVLSQNREDLIANIGQSKISIINPVGILAQELIQKWFYDLRIIVYKEPRKEPVCHTSALARAGLKDFRTNTALGNLAFGIQLPQHIRELAVKCGKALGGGHEAWVFGLDAMINVGENKNIDNETLEKDLTKAASQFEAVKKIRQDDSRLSGLDGFKVWNQHLEAAVDDYKKTDSYLKVKDVIEQNVDANQLRVVFHEANSCPDFWENTRLFTGMNLAVPLLKSAQSLTVQ